MKPTCFVGVLLVFVAVLVVSQVGCSLTQTASEHQHTYDTIVRHDYLLLPDDWDTLWEMDRPTRLSRWIVEY
jgi:hypothetical protein